MINMASKFQAKQQAQVKAKTPTDTLKAVTELLGANVVGKDGKECAVKVNMGFAIPYMKDDTNGMKTLGTLRARLVSVSREGQPWAGTDFKVWKTEDGQVAFMRAPDLENARPVHRGGKGRKPKAQTATTLQEKMGDAAPETKAEGNEAPKVKDLTA